MSKLDDVVKNFDYWMKTYEHGNATASESFKDYITSDRSIVTCGVSYDEYVALALKLKDMGYGIEWIVPVETFAYLVQEYKNRIAGRE